MFHAIKEHLAADANTHLENRTAKSFGLSAQQPLPPHPSAPFRFACSPHLPITPPSCFQLWLLFSTYLTAAVSPGGRRERLFSNAARQRPTSPCPPRGTNTSVDLGRILLRAHLLKVISASSQRWKGSSKWEPWSRFLPTSVGSLPCLETFHGTGGTRRSRR
ncbi:uncharacterized protein ACIBXB_019729 [Morphnus guianensis]